MPSIGALRNEPYCLEGKSGEAYLLLHGLGGGPYETQLLGAWLHKKGHTVEAIRYPGHEPATLMPASRWEDWYAHAEEHLKALRERYQQVHLVGFSTGCPLAARLAARHPVDGLLFLSPFLGIRRFCRIRPEWLLKALPHVHAVPRLGSPVNDPEAQRAIRAVRAFKNFNLDAVRSALELIENVRAELPSIRAPALILQSRADHVVDPEGAQILFDRLGSTEKKLCWLRRSNHAVALDLERGNVCREIDEFMNARGMSMKGQPRPIS